MPDATPHPKPQVPLELLTPPPRVTPWAAWSLAFGLGSWCFSVFAAIPAFVFGAVALKKIKTAPKVHTGKDIALAGLILGGIGCVVGTFVLAAFALPVVGAVRENARRDECQKNVAALAAACARYVREHNDKMPETLDELDPYLEKPASQFRCPSAKSAETAGYELIGAGENVGGKNPNITPLVRDSFPHHRIGARPARIEGYLDGRTPLVEEAKK
jgi:hypothetical protein